MRNKTVVVALGGNAITREFEEGNITQQFENTRRSLRSVIELIQRGYRVVITHGNGPQVGNALIRVEETRHLIPPLPLGVIVADLEGGMGYMIEQCLQNKLNERGLSKSVVTILTQMLVDKDDPSILNPTKFVGPFFKKEQIEELETKRGWIIKEDLHKSTYSLMQKDEKQIQTREFIEPFIAIYQPSVSLLCEDRLLVTVTKPVSAIVPQ